jgi:membrane-associated phospholipid phosphatase
MIDNKDLYQTQINMFVALSFDILCVAVVKAIVRRRRPSVDPYAVGPDVYSFPSGHASRATMILCFFTLLSPVYFIFWPALFTWTVSICISRLLLYRHHILDVLAGVVLGLFEAFFLAIIWLNQESCESVMNWMTDESNTGPEI